jgi:hypothetical protein
VTAIKSLNAKFATPFLIYPAVATSRCVWLHFDDDGGRTGTLRFMRSDLLSLALVRPMRGKVSRLCKEAEEGPSLSV